MPTPSQHTSPIRCVDDRRRARRQHRKRVARIVCTQWVNFAGPRLTAWRHWKRMALRAGLLAFKASIARKQRLDTSVRVLLKRKKYSQLMSCVEGWQSVVRTRVLMNKLCSSMSCCVAESAKKRALAAWFTCMMEKRRTAVAMAKASYFHRFMRMSTIMRALKAHSSRQRELALKHRLTLQRIALRCTRTAWTLWTVMVANQRCKQMQLCKANAFTRQRRLKAAFLALSSHCHTAKKARTEFVTALRAACTRAAAGTVHQAFNAWRAFASFQPCVRQQLQHLKQNSANITASVLVPLCDSLLVTKIAHGA